MTTTADRFSAPESAGGDATPGPGSPLAVRGDRPGIRYVPALDGLRAVAVLGVMLYHGGVPWMPGGFLGVDLFFVLSGFLITSLLLVEQARWGTVDFVAFWGRRARRLLPALFALLLFAAAYAVLFALPEQQGSIGRQGVATFFYVGNWWQLFNDQSYFEQFVTPSPLQHTWSLAIEEQYYLLFPVALAGLLVMRGTHRGLPKALAFLALASAAWMAFLYVPGTDPSRVYFSTFTRVQDLFVGGALAAAVIAADRNPGRVDAVLPARARRFLGPLLLVTALAFMALTPDDSDLLFRGGFLVFCAVVGVLLVIVSRQDPDVTTRTLSWRPLVYVGIISYGLYLWHWPLFLVLTPERTGLDGAWLLVVRFAVTFAVAIVSYLVIERPVRSGAVRRAYGRAFEIYAFLVTGAAVLAVLAVVIVTAPPGLATDGTSARTSVGSGDIKTFFLGDSVPMNLWQQFDPIRTEDIELQDAGRLGCGLIPVPFMADELRPVGADCDEWADEWPVQAERFQPDVAAIFPGIAQLFDAQVDGQLVRFGTPEFERYLSGYLDRYFERLRPSSTSLALVNMPCHRVVEDGQNLIPTYVNDDRRIAWLNGMLERYADRNPDITLIDFNEWLCPPGVDPEYRDGIKMRFDGLHFTREGAGLVWDWLAPQIRSIVADAEDEEASADGSASPRPSASPASSPPSASNPAGS